MSRYFVQGYERTSKWGYVEAESEDDAIEKAWRGGLEDVDTDPGPNILRRSWTACLNGPHAQPHPGAPDE